MGVWCFIYAAEKDIEMLGHLSSYYSSLLETFQADKDDAHGPVSRVCLNHFHEECELAKHTPLPHTRCNDRFVVLLFLRQVRTLLDSNQDGKVL